MVFLDLALDLALWAALGSSGEALRSSGETLGSSEELWEALGRLRLAVGSYFLIES